MTNGQSSLCQNLESAQSTPKMLDEFSHEDVLSTTKFLQLL